MTGVPWLTARQWLIVIHDLLATAAALIVTFFIRFEDQALAERLDWLPLVTVGLMAFAAPVYFFAGLHEAKWRFTSLPELARIIGASMVLAMSLLVLDYILLSPNSTGTFFFGKITIALYLVLQMAFLSGTRIAYRYFRDTRTQRHARAASRSDAAAWPRRRRRGAAARDRKRRDHEDLAGRPAVAVARSDQRRKRARRSGARRLRRSRTGRSRCCASAASP